MNPDSSERIERKYTFLGECWEMILSWLRHCYIPDPSYACGTVSNIYYDTPGLSQYYEKRNGDYVKCKVRLRWYADLQAMADDGEVRCFLEIKRRFGTIVQKVRTDVALPLHRLVCHPFSNEEITDLPYRVYELGFSPPGALVPILLLRYHRHRFLDPETGSRIALDTDIWCMAVNDAFIAAEAPIRLDLGVLEVKGYLNGDLPSLVPLHGYLIAASISKYARCLEQARHPQWREV